MCNMDPWDAIGSYFKDAHLERLVEHQIGSFNQFITTQLPQTIEQFNPVIIRPDQYFDKDLKKYKLEIYIIFSDFQLIRPQHHENNGSTSVMFPNEARLRNFTYASATTININIRYIIRSGPELEDIQTLNNIIPDVHIGKIPIMVKSCVCVLKQHPYLPPEKTGECMYDPGGYFIVNGSEKIMIGQEQTATNKTYCFPANNSQKYELQAEMKCSPDYKRISPKQVNMYLTKLNGEYSIHVNIPQIKRNIPIGILFRAMGIISDLSICKYILLNETDQEALLFLRGSLIESSTCLTQEDAHAYLTSHISFMTYDKTKTKQDFIPDILNGMFIHCKTLEQRIYLLGYMANKLVMCSLKRMPCDDRDSYLNKRISLTGDLLNDLYRIYFNKLVKDMSRQIIREVNTGSWKSKEDYLSIIGSNIYKLVKSTIIDSGIRRALSTGDFGTKQMNTNKVGVAQVLNSLTYMSRLSHMRRINKPVEKSGKLVDPRKLQSSSWGYLCPAETPEGQSVGVVKNLSYMTYITKRVDASSIYKHVEPFVEPFDLNKNVTKIFINGTWIGCTSKPNELYLDMKQKKYMGIISIYTSVVFEYTLNEIQLCTDSGRLVRPLFKVQQGKLLYTPEISSQLKHGKLTWNDLLIGNSVLEYIDPCEQNNSLISMTMKLNPSMKYTHCELHPSTIFGVLASCIPFPDRNQSPRNTYQCAMGKQAIGIYGTNYHERMDKTSWILNNPHKPLVDTRIMHLLQLHKLPSGTTIIVAIASYSGYNQEDSVILNRGSIERGLFRTTAFNTEKDEDHRNGGDDYIHCKPDDQKTSGMKFSNYSKLGADGIVPVNTELEDMTIIFGKISTIKESKNDPAKKIKYRDESKNFRTDERCYMDRNYVGVNGDGYNCWKGRIRADRVPEIGDKFSSRHGQKGTVGNILDEADMPFTASGVRPDIIINPHAIPSRMTIAQLMETLLGKVLLELGMLGDGTAFTNLTVDAISKELKKLGYESKGNEIMYNGFTGEQMQTSIFIGPAFYQRLKHMVVDKHHSRSKGPMVGLTRQPAEGRSRDGGLRFGEMERDCTISHGASLFTKERMYDASDKFKMYICKRCGLTAHYNDEYKIHLCKSCENSTEFTMVKIPYACKLLFQELITMNVAPRIMT